MKLEQLIELKEKIDPLIDRQYFTLIAPSNARTFEWFIERVYVRVKANSMVELLSNRGVVRSVLRTLNPEINLRIYVISKATSTLLIHQTLDEFAEEHKLELPV